MTDEQRQPPSPAVAERYTVFVASENTADQWRKAIASGGPVVLLSEADLAGVSETIVRLRPTVVIEQAIGASDTGRDFVRRLQWDPSFTGLDIRVIAGSDIAGLMTAPPPAGQLAGSLVARARRAEPLPQRDTDGCRS